MPDFVNSSQTPMPSASAMAAAAVSARISGVVPVNSVSRPGRRVGKPTSLVSHLRGSHTSLKVLELFLSKFKSLKVLESRVGP